MQVLHAILTISEAKMSSYKLIYFNGKGRAETARFMFAVAKQEYEDKRVSGDEWAEVKKSNFQCV